MSLCVSTTIDLLWISSARFQSFSSRTGEAARLLGNDIRDAEKAGAYQENDFSKTHLIPFRGELIAGYDKRHSQISGAASQVIETAVDGIQTRLDRALVPAEADKSAF